jgi:hypothetical protein
MPLKNEDFMKFLTVILDLCTELLQYASLAHTEDAFTFIIKIEYRIRGGQQWLSAIYNASIIWLDYLAGLEANA